MFDIKPQPELYLFGSFKLKDLGFDMLHHLRKVLSGAKTLQIYLSPDPLCRL